MAGLRDAVQKGLIGGLAVLVILSQAQAASSRQAPVRGICLLYTSPSPRDS